MLNLINQQNTPSDFNLRLGSALFSDPLRERNNAIVLANTSDATANIQHGDLLQVDFTSTDLTEGLYIITIDDGWIGYRFFQRMPDLRMRDETGCHPISLKMLQSIKVVGKVKDIYRSGNKGVHYV
jgi:hypothetical protein